MVDSPRSTPVFANLSSADQAKYLQGRSLTGDLSTEPRENSEELRRNSSSSSFEQQSSTNGALMNSITNDASTNDNNNENENMDQNDQTNEIVLFQGQEGEKQEEGNKRKRAVGTSKKNKSTKRAQPLLQLKVDLIDLNGVRICGRADQICVQTMSPIRFWRVVEEISAIVPLLRDQIKRICNDSPETTVNEEQLCKLLGEFKFSLRNCPNLRSLQPDQIQYVVRHCSDVSEEDRRQNESMVGTIDFMASAVRSTSPLSAQKWKILCLLQMSTSSVVNMLSSHVKSRSNDSYEAENCPPTYHNDTRQAVKVVCENLYLINLKDWVQSVVQLFVFRMIGVESDKIDADYTKLYDTSNPENLKEICEHAVYENLNFIYTGCCEIVSASTHSTA